MKLGICLLLLATDHDPLAKSIIPDIAKAGYDYAEIPLARIFSLSNQELQTYRKLFQEAKLPIKVFNNAIPKGLALAGPNMNPLELSRYIDRAIYLAEFMGASLITMSGPNHLTVPSNQTWNHILPSYVRFLKQYADLAASKGITLAIEPINEEEHSFISTLSLAIEAIEAANCSNLVTMIDSYHFSKQQDNLKDALKKIALIKHIHYATPGKRTYPHPEDMAAFRQFLFPLLNAGYNGNISIEAFSDIPSFDLPLTADLIKKSLPTNTII